MKFSINLLVKIIHHLLLIASIGFAFFLYSDDYDFFPWATHDEGLKFLHLIISIPLPLFGAMVINAFISRDSGKIHLYLLKSGNLSLSNFRLLLSN